MRQSHAPGSMASHWLDSSDVPLPTNRSEQLGPRAKDRLRTVTVGEDILDRTSTHDPLSTISDKIVHRKEARAPQTPELQRGTHGLPPKGAYDTLTSRA